MRKTSAGLFISLDGVVEAPIPLTLISSQAFETGVLNLVYAPAESAGDADYEEAKTHLPQPDQ